jgi:uncharacterized YccA/Bax inhibitor family protein
MRSNNPVFGNSGAFSRGGGYATFDTATSGRDLEEMYASPSATSLQTGRMTLDDVVMKTGAMFVVLLLTAAVGWMAVPAMPWLPFVALLGGLVLGLVISFKSSTNPALILSYAAVEGLFVGGISRFYDAYAGATGGSNIVAQAVVGTLAAFAAMLVLYKSGRVRATPKFTKMLMVAGLGYLFVGLISLVTAFFGVGGGWGFYGVGPLGLLLCAAGVALASLFLILDFDFIEQGIRNGAPARVAWLAAFGLVVTLVWLYLEILRLLAILRGNE